ncbi:peptide chain release factor 1 [bacterium]|jgi:peptide chain release factor 1|nr:peptide chain release factor 1 [bacterium]MBT3795401.1 peptide chain release factor 1 [bacterium]MBT4634022.1 peptide chain release factor 1 [bacterium]
MIEQKIRKELENAKITVSDIDLKLNSTEITADRIIELSKKRSQLNEIVILYNQLLEIEKSIEENQELLNDKEFKSLAEEELETLKADLIKVEDRIKFEVRPKDPLDSKDVIIEIRAGAGGDEAALFASDLLRMYLRYCERKKWNMEIINKNEIGLGGVKEVIASISGKDIYSFMKFESGVHRVQRVPATETSGRVHTSTATVVVLPEADDVEIEINEKDLRIDTYRASGAGGQHVNKTDSAVRITHIPSGVVVQNQDGKSQHQNRQRAMRVLNAKLFEAQESKKEQDNSKTRKLLVGGGDRSEKIRTYNFAQGRVSDHRINLTLHKLDYILDGDLDELNNELYKNYINEESGVN